MGFKDFAKYVYSYFNVPDAIDSNMPSGPPLTRQLGQVSLEGYLPMYDGNGNLTGYIAADPRSSTRSQSAGVPCIGSALQALPELKTGPPEVLYVKSANGEFIPITPSTVQGPGANLPPTAPLAIRNTPATPALSAQPVAPSNPKPLEIKGRKMGDAATRWDGWPDGHFEADFTHAELEETLNLRCHWAVVKGAGYRKGDKEALTWQQGKKSTVSCLGILSCENPVCNIIIRPNVKPASLAAQLRAPCHCGATLVHERCDVRSEEWKWSGGVHYKNGGYHIHRRPTHILHLLPQERRRFDEIVKSNPQAGPLQLVVGVQGIHGPGESVADISPVLLNQHRVGKERLKVKKGEVQDGDTLIKAFADFDKKCPGFVIHSVFGAETVISLQSDFMRSQLVKNSVLDGPVNGLVSDGAHGWWKVRESILIVSSTYCPVLLCWVPGVFLYSNGSSARHFMYHFITVLHSIAREAESRSIDVTDELFAGIMDFSQAERLGFIKAFIQFWNTRPDNQRLVPELESAAEKLLKGCLQHFEAAVTRICRMAGVIPPESVDNFRARAHGLVHCKTSEIFIEECTLLVQDFPNLRDWVEWWARPSHASMLFESERIMDIELWDSIPDTTNAEESMHWKLYCMANRDHAFLNGMYSLHSVACHFERQYHAKLKGIPIRYGEAEPWKVVAEQHGYTKPSRHRGEKPKQNDGRPPDTVKELLGSSPKKQTSEKKTLTSIPYSIPSFPWHTNSCWLDTSLQILHVVFQRLFDDISVPISLLSSKSLLKAVFNTYTARQKLSNDDPKISKSLGHIRDDLRTRLKKRHIIKNVTDFQSLSTWIHEIISKEVFTKTPYHTIPAFECLHVSLSKCSGTEEIGGPHVQINGQTEIRVPTCEPREHP